MNTFSFDLALPVLKASLSNFKIEKVEWACEKVIKQVCKIKIAADNKTELNYTRRIKA